MDITDLLDLDLSSTPWSLDFASKPPSPILMSSSPPPWSLPEPPYSLPQSLSSFSLSNCRPTETAGTSDREEEEGGGQVGKLRPLPIPILAMDGISDSSYLIKERMMQALRYFKESTDQQVLVQVWVPVKRGNRFVLTTSGQPFVLDPHTNGLLQYRTVSSRYLFSFDENTDWNVGLPGRVFRLKFPEWTPNVQYYSNKEYPRLSHALLYNVRGSLGLPVFDPSQKSCVGVVELIMTSQMINYSPEVNKVCRALEAVNLESSEILDHHSIQAVNLKSSEILDHHRIQIYNEGRQAVLAEILEILTVICESQKLPFAQTWVPCQLGTVVEHYVDSKRSCSSFNRSCMGEVYLSTTDAAFYVVDAHLWGFRDACSEHHLQKDQGVVGRAFTLQSPCFCSDITRYSKTEYPLVHYARMFGLGSSLALCLRSSHSAEDVYVIEFFLPLDCKDASKQWALLESVSTLMKQSFRRLKEISSVELQKGLPLEMIEMNSEKNNKQKLIQYALPDVSVLEGIDEENIEDIAHGNSQEQQSLTCINSENKPTTLTDNESNLLMSMHTNKVLERKRGKAEKIISLEVLQKYFSGSLKDAAKSLGVCPTTMKRICRQHGISRWPSRKINKVNRSLSKLKQVIESVQGGQVALNLDSLVCPLPDAAGPLPIHLDGVALNKGHVERDKVTSPVNRPESTSHDKLTSKELVDVHSASCSKSSSSEGTSVTPVSQRSWQASGDEECKVDQLHHPNSIYLMGLNDSLVCQNMVPIMVAEPEHADVDMLSDDSASSKLVKNLPATAILEPKIIVVKACYKDDIIRFRLARFAGVVSLNEEIARRLKLKVGTFDIKYLDDDHEWVKLACDTDLEECIQVYTTSGARVIRLSIYDISTHLGNTCERNDE
ncbi:hypothetical protein HPP92_024142 [Vanilla planifolia]|uniref:Uncharacterized protein n=1 Tax=Vanilla planifolia TaxID=51239 RepID=A0A835PJ48_VANPL|nr:hypothetical protein HPP92_024142 [Vanilla planifolia]